MYDIRRAVSAEAGSLTAIAKAAKAHLGYPAEWLDAWDAALTVDAAYLALHRVWVGVERESALPAGFVALVDEGTAWRLDHLWIAPEHQGRGLGRRLWSVAMAAVRESRPGAVRIEADPSAAGFYERCGARLVGRVAAPVLGEARELPLFEITIAGG
jgi:ribosomal protein S18 acetylase RimI-like enzyme